MQHKSDQKRTISIAEAAKALGLHRSTLLRQMQKGLFPNHNSQVVLAEVKKGRAENVHKNRGDRWCGGRGSDATDVAPGAADATPVHAALYDAFARLIGQAETTIAMAAIEAGASMRVAYATAQIGRNGLMELAEDILFPGPPNVDRFFSTRGFVQPTNWQDLALLAGEPLNLEDWKSCCSTLAWS